MITRDPSDLTEAHVQSVLVAWLANPTRRKDLARDMPTIDIVACNNRSALPYECDVIVIDQQRYIHELEIKLSIADYRREFLNKDRKHNALMQAMEGKRRSGTPNTFTFVTAGFIPQDIPAYAGLITIKRGKNAWVPVVRVLPTLLHRSKASADQITAVARQLSREKTEHLRRTRPRVR